MTKRTLATKHPKHKTHVNSGGAKKPTTKPCPSCGRLVPGGICNCTNGKDAK